MKDKYRGGSRERHHSRHKSKDRKKSKNDKGDLIDSKDRRDKSKNRDYNHSRPREKPHRRKNNYSRSRSRSYYSSSSSSSSSREFKHRRQNLSKRRNLKQKPDEEDIEEEYVKKQRKMQMRLAKVRKLKFEEDQRLESNDQEMENHEADNIREQKYIYKDEDQWLEEVEDNPTTTQQKLEQNQNNIQTEQSLDQSKQLDDFTSKQQQKILEIQQEEQLQQFKEELNKISSLDDGEDELDKYMEEVQQKAAPQENVDENFIKPIREALDKSKNQKQNMLKASLGLIVSEIKNQAKASGKKKDIMTQDMFQESYNQAIAGLLNSNLHQQQSTLSIFQDNYDLENKAVEIQNMQQDDNIEEDEQEEIFDESKVITFDQININKDQEMEEETQGQTEEYDNYHQQFIYELKESKKNEVFHLQDPTHEISHKDRLLQKHVLVEDESSSGEELNLPAFELDQEDDEYFNKKKKNDDRGFLKVVDHSQIDYQPFRKNFYIESKDITNMTQEQVEDFLQNNGNIKTRGQNCPKPIQN